ncbi:MAG: hypothetical protein Q7T82_11665 [Armatimonadota bacterium]|nr:hypothetical protein [Armatimonadota bacterium]
MAIVHDQQMDMSQDAAPRLDPWPEARDWKGPVYDPRHYKARRLKSLLRRPLLPIYSLAAPRAGETLRVLIADDGSALAYFQELIAPEGPKAARVGAIPSFLAPRLASADFDVVIIAANQYLLPLYGGERFHHIPKYVRSFLPVRDHPDAMLRSMTGEAANALRRNVRKALSAGFTCELTSDPSWFDSFYFDTYRPFVLQRFQDSAVVDDYGRLKDVFVQGFGLVLKRDTETVGGALMTVRDGVLYLFRVGMLDGDKATRDGASSALYYFAVLVARAWGCAGVDFGHSRPFLSDGVLRYKTKWGAKPLDVDDGVGLFALATPNGTPQAMRFVTDNPFYEMKNGRIVLCDEV